MTMHTGLLIVIVVWVICIPLALVASLQQRRGPSMKWLKRHDNDDGFWDD